MNFAAELSPVLHMILESSGVGRKFVDGFVWRESSGCSMRCLLVGIFTGAVGASFFWKWKQKRSENKALENSFKTLSRALDLAQGMAPSQNRVMIALVTIVEDRLVFQHVEDQLKEFLEYPQNHPGPREVEDILVPSMLAHHRNWVSQALSAGKLPSRLMHPLRGVEVRTYSGFYVRSDLNIEWMYGKKEPCFQLTFAACQEKSQRQAGIMVDSQREYHECYVLLMDIVEFTSACSRLTAVEVLHWMKQVRTCIEELLVSNQLQLIETRGDNYLVITSVEDGPSPATRIIRFASKAASVVASLHDTRVRVGIAKGPVTVARLQCMGKGDVLCAFGDVVNVAGRLEQAANPAWLHISESVARDYARDNGLPVPPGRCISAKGKPEGVRTARWDWQESRFLAESKPGTDAG